MSILLLYTRMVLLLSMRSLLTAAESERHDKCPCEVSISKMIADCSLRKLTSIPHCVPNDTQQLFLPGNQITYSQGQFQRFRNLKKLDLSHNEAFTARGDSFRALYHLQSLDLGYTEYTYLTDDIFADLHNLRDLAFSGPDGELNLNQALFSPLKSLTKLKFSYSMELEIQNYLFSKLSKFERLDCIKLKTLTLHTYSFDGLTALKTLSITDPIETIRLPEDIFKPLIQLNEIDLQGLCSALNPAFNCMEIDERLKYAPSLKRIYIDNILINSFGMGFQSLKHLEDLHLIQGLRPRCCEVSILSAGHFKNLEAVPLTKLFLDNCYIDFITHDSFTWLSNLSTLNLNIEMTSDTLFLTSFAWGLQDTKIEDIVLSISSTMSLSGHRRIPGLNETKLKSFQLSLTSMDVVSGTTIKDLPKSLVNLTLSNNRIKYFDVADLNYLENLEILDLSNQMEDPPRSVKKGVGPELFSEMEIDPQKVRKGQNATFYDCLTLPYKLKTLNVHNSNLLCVMTPLFCGSNNSLLTLDASEQRDKSCIRSNEFWTSLKSLVKLEELNLDWNLISEIPRNAFSRQTRMKTLSLKGNKLIELSFHIVAMVYLQTLDLSSNSIRFASSTFTKETKGVASASKISVDISDNPLVCDCRHQDFVAWLRDTTFVLEKNDINCTFENGSKISLGQIAEMHDLLEVECIMLEITVGCVALFSVLNLLLGSIAYTWHIRQKLGYLLSYGRQTLNPYHPIEDCNIEMEYDVYISYEGDSYVAPNMSLRDFVLHKLLPGLEQRGYKVGIREVFDPGRSLYEMISSAVRRSKKVLILLTKDYCKDMWNVFEFNQAVMEGIYTNRQIAIPILFESLGRDSVKEEVFAFLRMEPVAKYTHDVSDRAFIDYVCERIRDTTRKFN